MGLTVRQIVESLTTYGIMPAAEVAALREKVQAELDNDAEPLLRDLIKQNKLSSESGLKELVMLSWSRSCLS